MPKGAESRDHRKPCDLCHKPQDVLVRCQTDESGKWHLVCPGKCWKQVSGGVVDGDKAEEHKYYRYGGMWKNKHDAVSAKKPKGKYVKRDDGEEGGIAREDEGDEGEAGVELSSS